MDSFSNDIPQANAFIDDILVTTNGTEIELLVDKVLWKLNRKSTSLKLAKIDFAKREREWLGHRIMELGVQPLKRKTAPIDALAAPKTVKKIKNRLWALLIASTNTFRQ